MELTDWIVMLAIALMAIAFYCSRSGRHAALAALADRTRHRRGTRLLMQGAIALWSALLALDRSFVSPGALPGLSGTPGMPFGLRLSAQAVLAVSLVLVVAGCSWTLRGLRLVRTRHLFGAS